MGLDVSHDCWHGAYSAFTRWRTMLAKVAGMPPLAMMEGFWPFIVCYDNDMLDDKNPGQSLLRDVLQELPIKWECLKPDPLIIILNHSDCDGIIEHIDCKPLADRLQELVSLIPDGEGSGHIGNWRAKTQQFVDGLLEAYKNGEDVEFH